MNEQPGGDVALGAESDASRSPDVGSSRSPDAGSSRSREAGSHGPPGARVAGDWRAGLRARGYRLTSQRELVLHAVGELDHATPEAILEHLHASMPETTINASTVYCTLDLLERLSLVSHAHLGHGAPSYHLVAHPAHIHAVCRVCGEVIDLPTAVADPLVAHLRAERGFVVDVRHLSVTGTCARCVGGMEPGRSDVVT